MEALYAEMGKSEQTSPEGQRLQMNILRFRKGIAFGDSAIARAKNRMVGVTKPKLDAY
jgi:hypothetical protein